MMTYILCGGKGTRLDEINPTGLPKCLVPIAGKPILEWQLLQLKKYNINEVILMAGYKAEEINNWLHKKSEEKNNWGMSVATVTEDYPLGTGGLLQNFKENGLLKDPALIIYGDIIFNFDFNKFISVSQGKTASIVVHETDHPHDSSCVEMAAIFIKKWHEKGNAPPECNLTATGIRIITESVFPSIGTDEFKGKPVDLDEDILKIRVNTKHDIMGYRSEEFIKDIGTPERFKFVEKKIEAGLFDE